LAKAHCPSSLKSLLNLRELTGGKTGICVKGEKYRNNTEG
tara:strand:+ start:292 stop:411 length:120 start_codon:yes stop_codon:yes gene_type:complete